MARMKGQGQFQVYHWCVDFLLNSGIRIEQNYVFLPHRKFELDIAFPDQRVGVEVDGLAAGGRPGGHQLIKGWLRDHEKDLEAACHGWRVFRVATPQVEDGSAFNYLSTILRMYVVCMT